MPEFVISPNEQPIFDALLDGGDEPSVAYTLVRRIREMVARNIDTQVKAILSEFRVELGKKLDVHLAELDKKLDAHLAAQDSKLDALDKKFTSQDRWLRWLTATMVAMMAAILAFVAVGVFRGFGGSSVPAPQSAAVVTQAPAPAAPGETPVGSASPEASEQ